MKRRELIKSIGKGLGMLFGSTFVLASVDILSMWDVDYTERQKEYKRANELSNNEYITRYSEQLKGIRFGGTFDDYQLPPELNKKERLFCLDWVVKTFGLNTIRVGIKWKDTEQEDGTVNIENIDYIIKYCIKNNISLRLNVGPIKTNRYPEEYIPDKYKQNVDYLQTNFAGVIPNDSKIFDKGISYLTKLFDKLKNSYPDISAIIKDIQFDNEPFTLFGNPIVPSPKWIKLCNMLLQDYFPNAKQVINGLGLVSFGNILLLLRGMNESERSKFIIGVDYYHDFEVNINGNEVGFEVDVLQVSGVHFRNKDNLVKEAHDLGINIEISELQFEPWGKQQRPGNDAGVLKGMLLMVNRLRYSYGKLLSRQFDVHLWGIERFAVMKLRNEQRDTHLEIVDIIDKVGRL
jgi:hypothetical protein